MNYVKLKDGNEYKISENGTELLRRHLPSADFWYTEHSGSLKILDIIPESDTNVKCLLEDGKWYHIGSNGYLVLTLEQREKDRQEKKSKKEAQAIEKEQTRSGSGAGSIIGGVGAMIGSAKQAIKDYRSIDDNSFLEDASKDIFASFASSKTCSSDDALDENWFEDSSEELDKARENLRDAQIEQNKAIVFETLQTTEGYLLHPVLKRLFNINNQSLYLACKAFTKKEEHTERELLMWTDVFYAISAHEEYTEEQIDNTAYTIDLMSGTEIAQIEDKVAIEDKGIEDSFDDNNNIVENGKVGDHIDYTVDKSVVNNAEDYEETTESAPVVKSSPLRSSKYLDLESTGFSKDTSNEDFKEPKNALDIFTKGKNKTITKKKEKWNEAMWKFDHKLKKNVLTDLLRIEEDVVKLVNLEKELVGLTSSGHSSGFLGFGGSNELKKVKADIKSIKEKIVEHRKGLEESVDELRDCEEDIKDLQEDLYELTDLEKYANFKPLEGKGMSIVNQLLKNKKETDAQKLKSIFEL